MDLSGRHKLRPSCLGPCKLMPFDFLDINLPKKQAHESNTAQIPSTRDSFFKRLKIRCPCYGCIGDVHSRKMWRTRLFGRKVVEKLNIIHERFVAKDGIVNSKKYRSNNEHQSFKRRLIISQFFFTCDSKLVVSIEVITLNNST